jgi:glycosyltransferase involved in cell wall biosynthesis
VRWSGEQPLVSIVTPSLNQAAFLREAIESVRTQDYRSIEHIVVDGGSTDGTLEILQDYADLRWTSEPDRGQSHALNKGFAMARGPIFGWLNADDAYPANAVAEAVEALSEASVGLAYGDITRMNDDGVNPRRIGTRREWDLWTEVNLGCGIFSPAVFFTRTAYETVGGVDESLHLTMDYDLWLKIGSRFSVVHIDSVWGVQRIHDDAKTIRLWNEFWPERLRVSRRHGGRLVSPLLISRYVQSARARRAANRIAGAVYTLAGRGRAA